MAELHLKTDVMLVTPLHDGMNLVAKEHVLTRAIDPTHGPSTLVLSQFAGAIHELPEAIAVNPFSPESICDGIEAALALSKEEKSDRLRKMSFRLRQWTQEDWARRLVELTEKAPESSLSKEHRPYATLQA
jgi:trehalose-6-phosphate synthase